MFGLNKEQKTTDMQTKKIVAWLSFILFFTSCYYDNTDELNPTLPEPGSCDTINNVISYSTDIAPLLINSCGADNENCHRNSNTASLINLDNYTDVSTVVQDGSLLGSITHDPNFISMPEGGGMLDECSINKIKSWINHGALNN